MGIYEGVMGGNPRFLFFCSFGRFEAIYESIGLRCNPIGGLIRLPGKAGQQKNKKNITKS